jgi:hypothetical protein
VNPQLKFEISKVAHRKYCILLIPSMSRMQYKKILILYLLF